MFRDGSTLSSMLNDPDLLGRMTDDEFGHYWDHLGRAIRILVIAAHRPDDRERALEGLRAKLADEF